MLSRLLLAPRMGIAAARLARTAPTRRALPAFASATSSAAQPWIRTYSKSNDPSSQNLNHKSQPKSTPEASEGAAAESSEQDVRKPETESTPEAPKEEEQIPFDKLPDLTQGLPSTLEYELGGKDQKPAESALQQAEQESGGQGGRERAEYVSTTDRNRQWWTRFMLIGSAAGSVFGALYLGRDWDDSIEAQRHPEAPNGFSPALWYQRVRARWGEQVSYYQDPAFDKLLPDPDPSFERPYTLCISLDDLLVHSEWSREHGWRVAKRPGMDYFIRYLSQYYELVLFTTVPFGTGEPLVRKLDPFRFIMWPLYREATKYEDGEVVKDLSYLNRDLSKVIIIDTKAKHVRKQPENAIILDPWKGDPTDKELVSLIPFLEYIHTMQYADVRKVLKSFDGSHIPTEFARREAIARKEFQTQQITKARHKTSAVGMLGNMLGLNPNNMSMMVSPDGEQSQTEAFAQGKMLQDIARERGQRNYELLEREIRENGEKWLKEEAEMMEKAQKEAMNSMMGGFGGMFGGDGKEKKA